MCLGEPEIAAETHLSGGSEVHHVMKTRELETTNHLRDNGLPDATMDENVVFVCFGVEVGKTGQNVLEPLANQDKTHRTDARKHTASEILRYSIHLFTLSRIDSVT